MQHLNVEFKARCSDLDRARAVLRRLGATGPDVDRQVDTYFRVPHGRLKLREGSVERALIHYARPDTAGPKRSDVTLVPTGSDAPALKAALTAALGVWVVVDKTRKIFWAENVKLHLDRVEGLGTFVEVEAIARGWDERGRPPGAVRAVPRSAWRRGGRPRGGLLQRPPRGGSRGQRIGPILVAPDPCPR